MTQATVRSVTRAEVGHDRSGIERVDHFGHLGFAEPELRRNVIEAQTLSPGGDERWPVEDGRRDRQVVVVADVQEHPGDAR